MTISYLQGPERMQRHIMTLHGQDEHSRINGHEGAPQAHMDGMDGAEGAEDTTYW